MTYCPTVVEVMAEYTDALLWDRSPDGPHDSVVDPRALGVSPALVADLRTWNQQFAVLALDERFEFDGPAHELAWGRRGLELAYRLQNELGPDVEVRYRELGDDRPVGEQRGP